MHTNKIKLGKIVKCLRCEHEWLPRKERIITCSNKKCRSPYWNIPKVESVPIEIDLRKKEVKQDETNSGNGNR